MANLALDIRVDSMINLGRSHDWMTDAMNEDLPHIEPEWKSALTVIAVALAGVSLIIVGLWL